MRNTPHQIVEVKSPKDKPDSVIVIRYFRFWDDVYHQISSSGGMSVICKLDYKKNRMFVYPSFCSEKDNFNKAEGLYHAINAHNNDFGFALDFDKGMSIFENIYFSVLHGNINYNDIESNTKLHAPLTRWVNGNHEANYAW